MDQNLAYLNCDAIFEFLGQFTIRCIYYFSKKGVYNFEIEHKNANFGEEDKVPLKVYS